LHQRGALYAEVLVAVAILAFALVPVGNAIYAGLRASGGHQDAAVEHFSLISRMEELRAEPYGALEAAALAAGNWKVATTYSDAPGTPRRLVYLSHYDADDTDADGNPFTGTEPDLLWLQVAIEGTDHGLETLIAR